MITNEDIRKYSTELLDLLEREGISSIEGLQKRLGESFTVQEGVVQLEARPGGKSLLPTDITHTINYIVQGRGIPIEVRINPRGSYSRITLKSENCMPGYNPFSKDARGNIIQEKMLGFSFDEIIEELRILKQ